MTNKLIASAILALGFTTNVNAQASATATASATIVAPISITKNTDMNFGNIAVQAATGGTVILATDGSRTRTAGVTLPAVPGTVSAATFTVDGEINYTYDITLPGAAVVLTRGGGTETMSATAFTSDPAIAAGALDGAGTEDISVGATLTVAAAQVPGTYITGTPFTVTVNYN